MLAAETIQVLTPISIQTSLIVFNNAFSLSGNITQLKIHKLFKNALLSTCESIHILNGKTL